MNENRILNTFRGPETRLSKKRVSRSRNGCLRCKERRLKCDETRPACNQCQMRKHTCPGYQTLMRWSSKYEVFAAKQRPDNQSATSGVAKPPQRTGQPHGVGQANAPQYQQRLSNQVTRVADSEISIVGDPVNDDHMVELSLPSHTLPPAHDNGSVSYPSNNSYPTSDLFPGVPSPSYGHGIASGDGLTVFPLTDQEFWSSLTLDWSSIPFGSAEPLASIALAPAHSPAAEDVSTVPPAGKNLPTFDPSDVTDEDTKILLKHYFDNILSINSVYDNRHNPLRYLVSRYIKSSPLVRTCVLSASELHLMSNDRNTHQIVVRYHSNALKCIVTAMEQLESTALPSEQDSDNEPRVFLTRYVDRLQEALLALLLVGVSSSWLDPSDIGVNHLVRARRLFTRWMDAVNTLSCGTTRSVDDERNASFIIGAMAYWEMVTAFVANQAINILDYLEPFCHQSGKEKIYPNPWTGVSTPVCIVMAQVGVYIRQKLVITKLQSLGWPQSTYGTMLDELLHRAAKLETFVLGYEPPARSQVESGLESPLNAFSELESMAQTYRLTALLELYRCFPQLGYTDDNATSGSTGNPTSNPYVSSLCCGVLRENFGGQLSRNHETIIYELALSLLGLLKQTEERRAASLAHTLALLIGGSALRHWPTSQTSSATAHTRTQPVPVRTKVTDLLAVLNTRSQVVEGWRSFVRGRLKSNAEFVGLESFRRTQALMEKIWSRLDSNSEHALSSTHEGSFPVHRVNGPHPTDQGMTVHWLDVMAECRLESMFG